MGCFGFLKGMMFLFNGIIFLAGVAILGVGIWVKVDSGSIFALLQKIENTPEELNQVLNVGYLLIAIGLLLLVIGFLGCCGAVKECRSMLLLFFVIVLLVFIAEVAGAVVVLVFRPLADELFSKIGAAAVQNIRDDYGSNDDITGLWDTAMGALKCCGFYNHSDFSGSPYYNAHSGQYPPACCLSATHPCNLTLLSDFIWPSSGEQNTRLSIYIVPGCFQKIKDLIDENMVVIVGVALGIAALEVCAMIVSMTLYCKIKTRLA